MRRSLRSLVPLAVLSLGLTACSLLVDFDPEGQPCDRGQCLPGYVCQNDVCVSGGSTDGGTDGGTVPGSDAGVDGGSDGGADGGHDAGP